MAKEYSPLGVEDIIRFGKYKGKTVDYVLDEEPTYLEYLIKNMDTFRLTPAAESELMLALANKKR